ncbi:cryptochrome/photolyase family protein [Atopobacter phocae]|uniref:cryptochrome/photolyase family protein n=1 Tax=Atopobacter phocae TaxID=136492 RepID=UPI00047015AA|nr:deoxyribodipyrimidine photo-lyase [Atopobacter phocae]
MVSVLWFRRDLRLEDQKALAQAINSHSPVLCLFQFNEEQLSYPASRNQSSFVSSVLAFKETLKEKGIDLYMMHGDLITCFKQLYEELDNWTDIYFNYDDSGFGRLRDQKAAQFFRDKGIKIHAYQDHYIHGSQEIRSQSGDFYKVFTPYHKVWQSFPKEHPVSVDLSKGQWISLKTPVKVLKTIESLKNPAFNDVFTSQKGLEQLTRFIEEGLAQYHIDRDFPGKEGTSFLSPFLRIGAVGIRTVYHAVKQAPKSQGQAIFLKELAWRDFYNMIYMVNPDQKTMSIQKPFRQLEWDNHPDWFQAWKDGKTGYPIVDAAMLQLEQTGWMHNRLRMIVASFLIKDLMVDWRLGEEYFKEKLIDYDSASNIGGWQWAASTGTDAVPYFRIFNPVTQGKRFDESGDFIKIYLPMLENVSNKYIHEPWKMPKDVQGNVGCVIGKDYPYPIVDHSEQRKRAIAKYEQAKENAKKETEETN